MYNSRQSWIVTFILFLGQVINYFDKSVIGLAAVPIMRELNLTPQEYGLVASSFFSLYAVSGIAVGLFVAHRIPSKLLLTILVLIWSLSQLPVVVFGSLATLVGSRVVLGIGEGPGSPSATNACHEWFTPDRRNMPTALVMLGASIGSLIAGPILSYVIIAHGWRAAFVLCSGLGALWIVLWLVFGADGPGSIKQVAPDHDETAKVGSEPDHRAKIGQAAIWSDPTVIGSIVVGFTAYWVVGFTLAWLAPLVRSGLGYDAAATGWIMAGVAATNSAVLLTLSFVSQHLLRRGSDSRVARGIVNALCMLAGAGALLTAAELADPVAKLVFMAIGGGLATLTFVFGPAIVSEIVPGHHRGRFLITIYAGITVAGFVSPLVAGALIGHGGIAGYNQALLVNALVVAIGGLVAYWLLHPDRSVRRFARLTAALNPP